MIKRVFSLFSSDSKDFNSAKPHSFITQVNKHAPVVAAPQINRDDDVEDSLHEEPATSFWFSFCRCFAKQVETSDEDSPIEAESLLGPQSNRNLGKKTLVLDLDETLVHSSFDASINSDLIIPIFINNQNVKVRVMVRPGIEEYMKKMGELYEVVIFTASLSEYANPVIDAIDPTGVVSYRLYREHCTYYNGIYVKDLSRLGRDLKDVIIVDNSPNSFLFHPHNALLIKNYFDDYEDRELSILTPFFELMARLPDVRPTENWRMKFSEGKIEDHAKLIPAGPASTVKNNDESSENLSGTSPRAWAETDDEPSGRENKQNHGHMALTSILTDKKHTEYSKVPNESSNETPTKLLAVDEDDLVDFNSPKTEANEKKRKSKVEKIVLAGTRNQNRNCKTENNDYELQPFDLEKLKQLEIQNEDDVEDRKKIEEGRFLNTVKNIQSPVHHKLDMHFEFPQSTEENSGILPPPVHKITGNTLYRPAEESSEIDIDAQA